MLSELSPRLYHAFVRPAWFTRKYIHNVLQHHFNFDRQVVLDFGAGTGANCSLCDPENYLGVDASNVRVQFASKMNPGYQFIHVYRPVLPVPSLSFDVILIISVLHHLSNADLSSYVQEFHRVLKPDGTLIVLEPFLEKSRPIGNWTMQRLDRGKHIRSEHEYYASFHERFQVQGIKKFQKLTVYHELLFTATPRQSKAATSSS